MLAIKKRNTLLSRLHPAAEVILVNPPPFTLHHPPAGIAHLCEALRAAGVRPAAADLNIAIVDRFRGAGQTGVVEEFWRHVADSDCPWQSDFRAARRVFCEELFQAVEELASHPARIVGFSVSSKSLNAADLVARELMKRAPHKVILYGGYACQFDEIVRGLSDVPDYICVGEGEESLVEFVDTLRRGRSPGAVPGILDRRRPEAFVPRPPPAELDLLPWPRWLDFDLESYQALSDEVVLPVSASRGCSWGRCRFCSDSQLAPGFRRRRAESVLEEIEQHVRSRQVTCFSFTDLIVNGDAAELSRLCDLIVAADLQIRFFGQFLINRELTFELLQKLKAAGLASLNLGLETGAQPVMKKMRKGFSARMATRCLQDARRAGLRVSVNLISGFPGETDEDAAQTRRFLEDNRGLIDAVEMVNPCYINYGSPLWRDRRELGLDFDAAPRLDPVADWRTPRAADAPAERDRRRIALEDKVMDLGLEASKFWERPRVEPRQPRPYLDEIFQSCIKALDRPRRVLILRCAPVERISWLLRGLAVPLEGVPIDVLAQQDVADVLAQHEMIEQVHRCPPGPMGPGSVEAALLQKLQQWAYDWVIVPQGEMLPRSYDHVVQLARALSPANLLIVSGAGQVTLEQAPLALVGAEVSVESARLAEKFSHCCPAPWMTMVVHPGGDFTPCCWMDHGGDHQNLKSFSSLQEAWNGEYFQEKRRFIGQGRYDKAGCHRDCFYLNNRTAGPYEGATFSHNLNTEFLRAGKHRQLEQHYLARDERLMSMPAMLQTILFYHCNLRCFMCVQNIPKTQIRGRVSIEDLTLLLEGKEWLSNWVVFGGEVLLDRKFVEFFGGQEPGKNEHMLSVITTNGTVLDDAVLRKLTTHAFPYLIFSIDGARAATYETIRAGASHATVMQNLKRTIEHYRAHGKADRISWSYILMNSTLDEVGEAMQISDELGVKLVMENIVGPYPEENLFDYPHHGASLSALDRVMGQMVCDPTDGHSIRLANVSLPALERTRDRILVVEGFLASASGEAAAQLSSRAILDEIALALFAEGRRRPLIDKIARTLGEHPVDMAETRGHWGAVALHAVGTPHEATLARALAQGWPAGGARLTARLTDLARHLLLPPDGTWPPVEATSHELLPLLDLLKVILDAQLELELTAEGGAPYSLAPSEAQCKRLNALGNLEAMLPVLNHSVDEVRLDVRTLGKHSFGLVYRLASWLRRQGVHERSRAILERLLESPAGEPYFIGNCHYHLAEIAMQAGETGRARELARQCIAYIPDHRAAARLLEAPDDSRPAELPGEATLLPPRPCDEEHERCLTTT